MSNMSLRRIKKELERNRGPLYTFEFLRNGEVVELQHGHRDFIFFKLFEESWLEFLSLGKENGPEIRIRLR